MAWSTVIGQGPQGPATATLILRHGRGERLKVQRTKAWTKAPIGIELCVADFESVKGFDFFEFEGPYSPASYKRLVRLDIEAGAERFSDSFRPQGSISRLEWLFHPETFGVEHSPIEPDDFSLNVGDPEGDLKSYITIVRLLQRSPTTIEVIVTDAKDPKRTLRFGFPTDNVSEVVGKLMR